MITGSEILGLLLESLDDQRAAVDQSIDAVGDASGSFVVKLRARLVTDAHIPTVAGQHADQILKLLALGFGFQELLQLRIN
ncbi:malate dehydrogenase [Trichinella pseudospiralis]